jgi:mannose-6-phosphate isomerase-like protein (cupin superfamily)
MNNPSSSYNLRDLEFQDFGIIEVAYIERNPLFSLAYVKLHGKNQTLVNDLSDKHYLVISGSGEFTVGLNRHIMVREGDIVRVPKGAPHRDNPTGAGDMPLEMVVLSVPPFDPESEHVFPEG